MDPMDQITNVIGKPLGVMSRALNRPTAAATRGLYGLGVADALLGATTAQRIGAANGEVVLVARGAEKLEETAAIVREAGGTAHVYPCDLTDLDAIAEMTGRVQADLGRVAILVNNAGR